MTRLSEIKQHIASMGELQGVIGAMRSLAGIRVQEAQRALPGARRYAEVVEDAIGSALLLCERLPPPGARESTSRSVILFATEHGFVGGYNARLFDELERTLGPGDTLMIVGSRGALLATERKLQVEWLQPMASRCDGAAETTRRLTAELYRRILGRHAARVELIYGRSRRGGSPEAIRKTLLPLDTRALSKQSAQPPLINLPPAALLEKLTAEYVFALLTEAAIESIASENNARFAAMEAAHENITRKLNELNDQSREERQSEITVELLDVVTGTEALLRDTSRRH